MKVIIAGSTGMVGEGVLHECLNVSDVKEILIINRKHYELTHPKLKEIIHPDFYDISSLLEQLRNYDACFFCAGVSSIGKSEDEYYRLTYALTLSFAGTLSKANPQMTFCYISGAATDSSEKGKVMWARVKGKTENDLMKLPFKNVFAFRPGFMLPTKGLKNTLPYYKYVTWLYPFMRRLIPKYVSTLSELGKAMINAAKFGYPKSILEVKDIVELASK